MTTNTTEQKVRMEHSSCKPPPSTTKKEKDSKEKTLKKCGPTYRVYDYAFLEWTVSSHGCVSFLFVFSRLKDDELHPSSVLMFFTQWIFLRLVLPKVFSWLMHNVHLTQSFWTKLSYLPKTYEIVDIVKSEILHFVQNTEAKKIFLCDFIVPTQQSQLMTSALLWLGRQRTDDWKIQSITAISLKLNRNVQQRGKEKGQMLISISYKKYLKYNIQWLQPGSIKYLYMLLTLVTQNWKSVRRNHMCSLH